jgi:RHS repeat-associated protein
MLVPNRNGNTKEYRYGFNGMQKDDEIKGGQGNSYDFGARMLDPRIGRWFATDPKESKFPNESPFIFVTNNPIVALDPDGNEKIVVSGGADLHNKNRMNFISAAKNQIREYKKAIAKSGSKEGGSWLIFDKDFTSVEKKAINQWVKKNGVGLPIFVASADEVGNYINSKSTTDSKLTIGRTKDGVTALSFMAHGVPSAVALGYENTGWVAKEAILLCLIIQILRVFKTELSKKVQKLIFSLVMQQHL